MGKAQRKINKLRRKKLEQSIGPRIPVAPPTITFKSKKDYSRKNKKKDIEKEIKDNG
jgi:hypothetical protein